MCAQRAHDGHVQAACTEPRRGDVDDAWWAVGSSWLVAARTATDLPIPTWPVMTPKQRLADAEADACHCLLMAGTFAQFGGRDGFREAFMMPGFRVTHPSRPLEAGSDTSDLWVRQIHVPQAFVAGLPSIQHSLSEPFEYGTGNHIQHSAAPITE
jgi:hypothetical protein